MKPAFDQPSELIASVTLSAPEVSDASLFPTPLELRETDFPALYRLGKTTAERGQRWYKRLVLADLLVLAFGGLVGAFASFDHGRYRATFAICSAAILSIGLTFRLYGRTRPDSRNWLNGRAVTETVKSETWLYMMRTPPYDGSDADHVFTAALVGIRKRVERLDVPDVLGGMPLTQITPRMRAVREWSLQERRGLYRERRLADQINWYLKKAKANGRRANELEIAAIVSQATTVVFAIVLITTSLKGINFVGFFAAAAAAMTIWTQVGGYGELARSYPMAAADLIDLSERDRLRLTEECFAETVREGEAAISRENTLWLTKRAR